MIQRQQIIKAVNAFSAKTQRLSIRRFCAQDIEEEMAQDTNPEIIRFIKDIASHQQALARAESIANPWQGEDLEWAGFTLTNHLKDHMLGAFSMRFHHLDNETFEIGFRLGLNSQGKGYMTEVGSVMLDFLFNQLDVHKVVAYCVEENIASWKLMEKLGMQREGCLRNYSILNGRWCNELVYGILRTDYQQ